MKLFSVTRVDGNDEPIATYYVEAQKLSHVNQLLEELPSELFEWIVVELDLHSIYSEAFKKKLRKKI